MTREKKLIKNTLIISIGKICTKLITFLLLPLYTGILSTEEFGNFDLLNTLVSLLLPIITFQVEQAVFRELVESRKDKTKTKNIISSSIISVTFQCLISILIFLIISPFIHNDYKIYLIINVIASIYNSLFLQISRGIGNNFKYALGSFLSALETVIFNIIFLVVFKLGVTGMLLGTILGQALSAIYMFITLKLYKYLSISSYKRQTVKELWKFSLPLIPNQISWWIFNSSDRIIVSTLLGLSATGILSAANKFSAVYITLYNIFNMSWTESISLHIKDKDIAEYFNKIFNTVLNLFMSISLLMISLMPIIYPIMINKKFISGYNLVPILILASLFNIIVSLIGVVYVANKNTKEIANTSILSALINIVSHLLLIRFIGLYAAAISTLLSYLIMAIYRLLNINKKYFKVKLNKVTITKTIITTTIILIIYYINNIYLNILSIIITIIFSWDLNKKTIKPLIRMLNQKLKKKVTYEKES